MTHASTSRSIRLSDELQQRLVLAAAARGVPVSSLVREAVAEKCDAILARNAALALKDVIGVFEWDESFQADQSREIWERDLLKKYADPAQ